MWDVTVKPGRTFIQPLRKNYSLTALAIRGDGSVTGAPGDAEAAEAAIRHKDFAVIEPEQSSDVRLTAAAEGELRLILIEVPTRVSYPLYRK